MLMYVKLEGDHHNLFTFLQRFSELLHRVLYNIHYPPHIGDLVLLGRAKVVMGIFTNKRSTCNEFSSQEGASFKSSCGNKSVFSWTLALVRGFW